MIHDPQPIALGCGESAQGTRHAGAVGTLEIRKHGERRRSFLAAPRGQAAPDQIRSRLPSPCGCLFRIWPCIQQFAGQKTEVRRDKQLSAEFAATQACEDQLSKARVEHNPAIGNTDFSRRRHVVFKPHEAD